MINLKKAAGNGAKAGLAPRRSGWGILCLLTLGLLSAQGVDYLPDAAGHIGTILINNDAQFTTSPLVTLTINAVPDSTGRVLAMQFSNGGDVWSAPEPYQRTKRWQLLNDGVYPPLMTTVLRTVYVRFQNGAGLWSKAVSDSIVFARSPADVPRIKQVFIAQQLPSNYDGAQPLGSQPNPYIIPAGNNEVQFDGLMCSLMKTYYSYGSQATGTNSLPLPATNSTVLNIFLGAGVYETHGDDRIFGDNLAWSPCNGWRIFGAGKDVTILKAVGVGSAPLWWADVIGGYYGDVANYDNFELRDLTVDANLREPGPNAYRFSNGITLVGNNVQIRRVKIKNFGTTIPGAESGGLGANNFGSVNGSFNLLIEDCEVVQAQLGDVYPSGMLGVLGTYGTNGPMMYYHNVIVRNCYIDGAPYWNDYPVNQLQYSYINRASFGICLGGTVGAIMEDNLIVNTVKGYYVDSSTLHDLVIRNNHFRNVFFGADLALGVGTVQTNQLVDVLRFENNFVELDPQFYPAGDDWGSYGRRLGFRLVGAPTHTNDYVYNHVVIAGNIFQFTGGQLPQANVSGVTGFMQSVRIAELQTNSFRGLSKPITWDNNPQYLDQQVDIINQDADSPVSCRNNKRPDTTVIEAYPYVLDKDLPRPVVVAGSEINFAAPGIDGVAASFVSGFPVANSIGATALFRWRSSPQDVGRYVVNFYSNPNRTKDPRRTLLTLLDRLDPSDPHYFANGLMAFWKLDETSGAVFADSSGNGSNIDVTVALSRGMLTFGVPGYAPGRTAVQFNGSSSIRNAAFTISNTNLFTGLPGAYHPAAEASTSLYHPFAISFWVNVNNAPTSTQLIFSDYNNFVITVGPGSSSSGNTFLMSMWNQQQTINLNANLSMAGWHHVVWVYDGVSVRLYADGTKTAEAAFGQVMGFLPANAVTFGGGWGYDDFVGRLGGFAIWGRPLRDEEVARMYAEQSSGIDPVLTPVAPSELKANFVPGGPVNLSWRDNSSNETGFVVERSYDGTTFTSLASVAANVTAYTDALPAATTYYRVKAVNPFGGSDYSNIAAAGGARPAPPMGVRVLAAH